MPRNTKVADVIRLVPCPKCGARVREHCHRPSGRNHSERVHDAIVAGQGHPGSAKSPNS